MNTPEYVTLTCSSDVFIIKSKKQDADLEQRAQTLDQLTKNKLKAFFFLVVCSH